MRAAIYDPYLDTGGGGERYMMTVASILAKRGWDVDVVWPDVKVGQWLQSRLGIDLSKVSFVGDIARGSGYDLVFWLSDGSIPLLFAKRTIIHFQTPFVDVGGSSLLNQLKLARVDKIVCNSKFTKRFIDGEYGVNSVVLYPPVDTVVFHPGKKENLILFVGRFSGLQQQKRQDILIDVFSGLYKKLPGWRLFLAGGSEVGGNEVVVELKKRVVGLPVVVAENVPLDKLQSLYARAKIFWSAVGYGADEERQPHEVEHFGISAVEAMAAGCVPILIAKGGYKEIVEDGKSGFLWESTQQLEQITLDLVENEKGRVQIARDVQERAENFSAKNFERKLVDILQV